MLTAMTEDDWAIVLQVFRAVRSRRGDKGRDDRKFLEALHYFTVHNITWRALSAEFGHWNSIWKRFWRLSRAGIFEAFFDALAALSESAHLVQMFDSTVARAHVSAAGAKGGQDDQALGRSRGGFSTKIHLKVDLDGLPLAFHRAPPSPTKVTTPNPIATAPASAAFVRSFRIARLQPTDQLSSRKSSTKRGRASSRPSANSSASSASPFVARRLRAITVPSSRSPSASS